MNETLKALSDPIRRKILDLLKEKPRSAGEISEHFELAGATISHHLSVLKSAGLVDSERYGTFLFYSLNTSILEEVLCWVMGLKENTEDNLS